MKRFTVKFMVFSLFFSFIFVLVNAIFLFLLVNTDEGFKKRLQSLKFDNPDFDLLVLGTSFAEYGIDTEYLTSEGLKSFNLALAGNSFETSYIQLEEYLNKYDQRPEYVFLVFNSYREKSEKDVIEPIVEVTMQDYKYGLRDAPILRFTWLGTEMIKKVLSSKHRKARLSFGQVKFEKSTPDNTNSGETLLDVEALESRYWAGEIADLCEKNGIVLILIDIPGFRETQNMDDVGPYILHFQNGHSATLYNFNSQKFCTIFDSRKDWIGNSHLNNRGANKFTRELYSIIEELH